jgi:hypothetical protein
MAAHDFYCIIGPIKEKQSLMKASMEETRLLQMKVARSLLFDWQRLSPLFIGFQQVHGLMTLWTPLKITPKTNKINKKSWGTPNHELRALFSTNPKFRSSGISSISETQSSEWLNLPGVLSFSAFAPRPKIGPLENKNTIMLHIRKTSSLAERRTGDMRTGSSLALLLKQPVSKEEGSNFEGFNGVIAASLVTEPSFSVTVGSMFSALSTRRGSGVLREAALGRLTVSLIVNSFSSCVFSLAA